MIQNIQNNLDVFYQNVKNGKSFNRHSQIRDLTKIRLTSDYSLIVAVDSDGGIGSRPGDVVACNNFLLGRFAMRVPLMEVIASGSLPLAAFNVLTFPMDNHATEIIRGIRAELMDAGLDKDFPLSGSTEDNVVTRETGIGTMAVGIVNDDDFRPGSSLVNDKIFCVGKPKSAPEDKFSWDDMEIINWSHLNKILKQSNVHDILPVGSKGILYEAQIMAETAQLKFISSNSKELDYNKSAGPSTCIIVSANQDLALKLPNILDVSVICIGQLALK